MRYPKDHKEEARRDLLERGARHAKKHGYAGSGMDAIAAAAGVTTGALYRHFSGKSDLFAALVQAELRRMAEQYGGILAGDPEGIAAAVAGYLSMHHVRHPETGCALPSLTPEVARAGADVRAAFERGVLGIVEAFERATGSREAAWSTIAQIVGAVMLSRAMVDEGVQRELLGAARRDVEARVDAAAGRRIAGGRKRDSTEGVKR